MIKQIPTQQQIYDLLRDPKDHKYIFKSILGSNNRTYFYPINSKSPANDIWVTADPRELVDGFQGFQGCGGATLKFTLEDNSIIQVKGPWNTNPDNLYKYTGIDLREQILTFIIISPESLNSYQDNKFGKEAEVYYIDDMGHQGIYHRYLELVHKLFTENPTIERCWSIGFTGGGSMSQFIDRDKLQSKIDSVKSYSYLGSKLSLEQSNI